MALWLRVRAALPDDNEALTALAALYEHHDRWRELAEVLERQLAAASAEAAPALVEQQAHIWTRLGDRAAAEAAWRRLTTLTPQATNPLRALVRLLSAGERWGELAEVLERLVELAATPDEVAETATQLARLEAATLERPERAIAALAARARLGPAQRRGVGRARHALRAHRRRRRAA